MGPSQNKQFTYEELRAAWLKFGDKFEKKNPKLDKFVVVMKNTEPVWREDSSSVIFKVGNSLQQKWIEDNISSKLCYFLRRELSNNQINLRVEIKNSSEVAERLYLPEEKDSYLTKNSQAFKELKEDLGAELLN